MKAILTSIRPRHACNILNLIKLWEIRKKFPKDYVGWVYIYCTKENDKHEICIYDDPIEHKIMCSRYHFLDNGEETRIALFNPRYIKGKVIARFWCDKVEEHRPFFHWCIEKETCLTRDDVLDYLDSKDKFVGNPKRQGKVYAIHITNLEIFDKPREIKEFRRYCDKHFSWWKNKCLDCKAYTPDTDIEDYCNKNKLSLTRAPQSWCYVEI